MSVHIVNSMVLVATVATFIICLIGKWGLIQKCQESRLTVLSKLANCEFCISFWMCTIVSVIFSIFMGDATLILLAVPSTPITRFLL